MYETPECALLDKKSIKLENVQDFQWSPAAPILSACQAEQSSGNLPARVVLLKIPERTELRQKNLFSVSGRVWVASHALKIDRPWKMLALRLQNSHKSRASSGLQCQRETQISSVKSTDVFHEYAQKLAAIHSSTAFPNGAVSRGLIFFVSCRGCYVLASSWRLLGSEGGQIHKDQEDNLHLL